MRKALVLEIVLGVIVVIVGSFFISNLNSDYYTISLTSEGEKNKNKGENNLDVLALTKECENTKGQVEKDWCFYGLASDSVNLEICDKISEDAYYEIEKFSLRDHCYESIALKTNNPSICEKISLDSTPPEPLSSSHFQDGCKDNIYLSMARDSQDTSKCELIIDGYWKEQCVVEIGIETLD